MDIHNKLDYSPCAATCKYSSPNIDLYSAFFTRHLVTSSATLINYWLIQLYERRLSSLVLSNRWYVVAVCRFIYKSSKSLNGTFTSPNYPGFYPRNTECHYLFLGDETYRVAIAFRQFDVDGIPPKSVHTPHTRTHAHKRRGFYENQVCWDTLYTCLRARLHPGFPTSCPMR